jgi:glyoxylase-like metal-dependent hydrolase (beta-lactamase superfamily II)
MKIATGVEMLEITANIMGTTSIINPTLIWDKDTVILVDAGFPGQLPNIRKEIEKTGIPFEKLSMVILTHQDIDHIGSASSILNELKSSVKILAHETEKSYINGEKTPLKLAKLEANLNLLPENMKTIYEKLKVGFKQSIVNITQTLTADEELPYCGGVKVIFTPGHTLGHICLYLKESKTLIAGDLLTVKDGILVKTDEHTNFDTNLSIKSLKKLTKYDIQTVICYHGGMYNNKSNERITELVQEY